MQYKKTNWSPSLSCILSLALFGSVSSSHAKVPSIPPIPAEPSAKLKPQSQHQPEALLVSLSVNQLQHKFLIPCLIKEEIIYLRYSDLSRLNIKQPKTTALQFRGEAYYPLSNTDKNFRGSTAQINKKNLSLAVQLPATAFNTSQFPLSYKKITPNEPGYGATFSYDMVYNNINSDHSALNNFENVFFSPYGRFVNSALNLINDDQNKLVRLNTSWLYDDSDKMLSYSAGDSISTPGIWGNSLLYGGLQLRSDFSTQPNFSPSPTTVTAGEAKLPSTVELYLNNISLFRNNVAPGPFEIEVQPPNIGLGTLKLVTTDILGRQQIVDLPFYSSSKFLKKDLHEYALDVGFIRNQFGSSDFNYGRFFASGSDTYGLTDSLTAEHRFEYQSTRKLLGSTWFAKYNQHLFTFGGVLSRNDSRLGNLGIWGYEYDGKVFDLGLRGQFATDKFTQIGQNEDHRAFKSQVQLIAGASMKPYGLFRVSMIQQQNRDTNDQTLITTSYSRSFHNRINLLVNLINNVTTPTAFTLFLYVTYTPKIYHSSSVSFIGSRNGNNQGNFSYSRSRESNYGTDYRINGSKGEREGSFTGNVTYNHRNVYLSGNLEKRGGKTNARANAQGTFGFFNQRFFSTTPLDDTAFALVHVPNFSNISVFKENRLVAVTDERGYAIVPRLTPYSTNKIHINGSDLPLNTNIANLDKTVIPTRMSGLYIPFNVKEQLSIMLRLKDSTTGNSLPPGSKVFKASAPEKVIPTDNYGRVYIADAKSQVTYQVKWRQNECQFTLPELKAKSERIEDIGDIFCVNKTMNSDTAQATSY